MDFGFSELMVIGVVALIVVGPKDLPGLFKQLGRFTAKMRKMAREFTRAMEDAADEAGVKEATQSFKDATSHKSMGLDKITEAADKFDKWDPTKPSQKAKDIGSETAELSEERAESARKYREYSAKKGAEKRAAEKAAAADTPEAPPEPESPPEAKDAS